MKLVAKVLGVQQVLRNKRLFWGTFYIDKIRKYMFKFSKDKACKYTNSWSSRRPSQDSGEILIKVVLKSIQAYVISISLLSTSLVDKIEKTMDSFHEEQVGIIKTCSMTFLEQFIY